jgi:SpoIIAA-like
MPPRVLIENEYATLWYHADGRIVHHKVHKPIQGPPFREMLTRGAELFEKNGAQKWLSDDRGNAALHPDDSKWASEIWSARVVAAGWRAWAIVMPEQVLGKLNMKRFISMYADQGVEVQIFTDPDAALRWLRSLK